MDFSRWRTARPVITARSTGSPGRCLIARPRVQSATKVFGTYTRCALYIHLHRTPRQIRHQSTEEQRRLWTPRGVSILAIPGPFHPRRHTLITLLLDSRLHVKRFLASTRLFVTLWCFLRRCFFSTFKRSRRNGPPGNGRIGQRRWTARVKGCVCGICNREDL